MTKAVVAALLGCMPVLVSAGPGDRLLATGGASMIEGAAGGGIVPWAVMTGYGTREQWGGAVFATRVDTGDYRLDTAGASVSYANRVELSFARQRLGIDELAGAAALPESSLNQDVFGAKFRLFDTEAYVAASRLFLGGAFGYNLLVNGTLRYSRANETGLLGFGGDRRDTPSLLKEGSIGVFLNPQWVLGVEYREKPDNLGFAGESDWKDVWLAYFPSKRVGLVAAWTDLGEIATLEDQTGLYLSVQISY